MSKPTHRLFSSSAPGPHTVWGSSRSRAPGTPDMRHRACVAVCPRWSLVSCCLPGPRPKQTASQQPRVVAPQGGVQLVGRRQEEASGWMGGQALQGLKSVPVSLRRQEHTSRRPWGPFLVSPLKGSLVSDLLAVSGTTAETVSILKGPESALL